MIVWIINHYAWPPTSAGGTRHHALARELIRRGHQVQIFAANFNHLSRETRHIAARAGYRLCEEEGVPFCWIDVPRYRGNSFGRVWNMLWFARRLLTTAHRASLAPPDVVVGSSVHPFAAWAAQRCARRFGVPFVFEVRDLWPQTLLDLGSFKRWHPLILLLSWLELRLYQQAHEIITLLPGAADYIAAKGAARDKITWIPNGVDFSLVPPAQPPAEDKPFVITYAGAIGLANGLDALVEVARRIWRSGWGERVRFRVYGHGPEKPRLVEECRREGLDNVEFMEPVPKSQVYVELLRSHAFFLFIVDSPLYRWGYSMNKLFDYLACARPVLLVSSAAYNPVAQAEAGITVSAGDPDGVVQAVRQLVEMSSAERWKMGMNGRRFAEANHDFQKLAVRLEGVLNRSRFIPRSSLRC